MSKDKNFNKDLSRETEREADLNAYDEDGQVSVRAMDFGLWLAKNRRKLIRGVIGFLIAVSAFFFIFSIYNLFIYLNDDSNDSTNNNLIMSPRKVTEDLQSSAPQIFKSNGRYDLAVKLRNPNEKFSADFKYCFVRAALEIACGDGFVLPGEEKYLLALGRDLSAGTDGVIFKITDIAWQRLDGHQVPNWTEFAGARLNFAVMNINFSSADESGLSDKIDLNNLAFSIKNQSPYGYYEAPLNILFYSGSELIGVNRYLLINFLAGEKRDVNLIWPGALRAAGRVEITADLNILDADVYLKYQGGNPE